MIDNNNIKNLSSYSDHIDDDLYKFMADLDILKIQKELKVEGISKIGLIPFTKKLDIDELNTSKLGNDFFSNVFMKFKYKKKLIESDTGNCKRRQKFVKLNVTKKFENIFNYFFKLNKFYKIILFNKINLNINWHNNLLIKFNLFKIK